MISFLSKILIGKQVKYRGVSKVQGSMYCYREITFQYTKSLFFEKWTDMTDSNGNVIIFEFDLDNFIDKKGYKENYIGIF